MPARSSGPPTPPSTRPSTPARTQWWSPADAALSVMEPAAGPRRVPRRRQLLQLLDLLAQVVEQHVGHVHRETAAHHDAQRRKVLTVLREGVGLSLIHISEPTR